MAGLLDFLNTPEGVGLLSAVAGGMAGARQGTPINNIGRGAMSGLMGYQSTQDQLRQREQSAVAEQFKKMQIEQMQRQIEQQKNTEAWKAGLPGIMTNAQPRVEQFQPDDPFNQGAAAFGEGANGQQVGSGMVNVQPGNPQALQDYLMKTGSPYADKIIENMLMPKSPDYKTVGDTLVEIGSGGVKPVFTAPEKKSTPSAILEYQFAKEQGYKGNFDEWKKSVAKAGASNVSTKIENKVGESIAGQVGPMMKSSVEKTTGAINLANSSRMMIEALDKNNAFVGPMANARLKLAQFGQILRVGGKNEEDKINNTRQLIRSLAEGSVEARKELAGQGQVTESEAAAVQKAYSGNIEDLTANEIRLIAGLNIKRERLARERHNRMMQTAPEQLKPFYQIDPETPSGSSGGWGIQKVQ